MNDWSTLKKLIWTYIVKAGGGIERTVSGPIVHITNALARAVKSLTVNIEPVQAGSGDPSPTNVRPISGWTSATVTRAGGNLLNDVDPDVVNAYIDAAGRKIIADSSNRTVILPVKANTVYYYSWNPVLLPGQSDDDTGYCLFDEYPQVGVTVGTQAAYALGAITTGPNTKYIAIKISNTDRTDFQATLSASTLSVGSTPIAHVPYTSDTYGITFPTEAGTVYGGTLTVNDDGTGTLLVDSVKCPMWTPHDSSDWKLTWYYDSTPAIFNRYVYYADAPQNGLYWPADNSRVFCECYKNAASFEEFVNSDYAVMAGYPSSYEGRLIVKDSRFTDAVTFNQWLRNNNVYASYKIIPQFQQTYQLTAQQVINTLLGTNNIWADTGDVTVTYYASA